MMDDKAAQKLNDLVEALVGAARKAGADASDAVAVSSRAKSVTVRLGKVESTDSSESDDISLRVFVGDRVASVSASGNADITQLAERAVAMAKASPSDPHQRLADKDRLATSWPDLDLLDTFEPTASGMTDTALAMEDAARAVEGVINTGGASASAGMGGLVLATSHGFSGSYFASRYGRSVSVIAGEGTGMERDYDFSSAIHYSDLEAPEIIGKRAGERTVRRLGATKAETGPITAIYDPRVARGLAGTLGGAINGASVARKTSFWRDSMGKQIASAGITVTDDPKIRRGSGSKPFDGEGVSGERLIMVAGGVLQHWFLSTSAASELGLEPNGRGVRASSSVNPSSTNLAIEPGEVSPEDLIASVKSGIYVTEVFGQGVNMVTGEYSRGASGFLIENGELTRPVSEITIAANLKDMFMNMTPANDIDRSFATAAPTLMVEGMTLAGK